MLKKCLTLLLFTAAAAGCVDEPEATSADMSENGGERPAIGGGGAGSAVLYPRLDGSYAPDCEGYTQRVRDCGLLSAGPFQCNEPESSVEVCSFECLAIASCSILAEALCNGMRAPALERCLSLCNGFTCGSGEVLPRTWLCDGEPDCDDSSDETACEFACDSGELVPAFYQCDYAADCADGSDERGCPGFQCASGQTIADSWRCDLQEDCEDGSDEVGCQEFVCAATGVTVLASWRCDGEDDCLDGSDEFDCARLLCR